MSRSVRLMLRVLVASALPIGCSQGGPDGEQGSLTIARDVEIGPADEKAVAIVGAARAFLATLSPVHRGATVYLFLFADNQQRARWSNFPARFVQRAASCAST